MRPVVGLRFDADDPGRGLLPRDNAGEPRDGCGDARALVPAVTREAAVPARARVEDAGFEEFPWAVEGDFDSLDRP